MLANIPRGIFIFLLTALPVAFVAIFIGMITWTIIKFRKKYKVTVCWVLPVTIFSMIIMAASWIFNIGWLRFMLTILAVPICHIIIYFMTNILLIPSIHKHTSMKVQNIVFTITFLLTYLFFPDGGDYGSMYFFFGLVKSDELAYIAYMISVLALLVHVVLFITQIVFAILKRFAHKKKHKNEEETTQEN